MPIFEYKCLKCGHKFEELVSGGKSPHCPKCGSVNLKKLISSFSTNKKSEGGCSSGSCPACNLK